MWSEFFYLREIPFSEGRQNNVSYLPSPEIVTRSP